MRTQAVLPELQNRLESAFPDNFARLTFAGPAKIIAHFDSAPDQSEFRRATAGLPASIQFEVGEARYSAREAAKIENGIRATTRSFPEINSIAFDPVDGVIYVNDKEDAQIEAALRGAIPIDELKIIFRPEMAITLSENAISGSTWNAETGSHSQCTIGLSVIDSSGTKYTTTAGHCNDDTARHEFNIYQDRAYGEPGGSRLNFISQRLDLGMDIQWHTLRETDDAIRAYYWDGSQSVPIKARGSGAPTYGQTFCKFGRKTSWTCGTVGSRVWRYGGYMYYLTEPNGKTIVRPGDSGAGVVQGNTGWGWVHGQSGTGSGSSTLVFMIVQEIYDHTDLRILGCSTC
ncbi:S1 family peptidase [Qipengyuania gelatinilytica]|uniref:S1 family peptidase n=1 Tax=Qipengyuania gelatinilytica TaxID=2867231 RepID=A0ABX9A7S9_9SPHN|nr:S1 family peptidase [Qipengyuania gelatinilytica]QZD95968.1 S1 family peptidase [Qipengyuania gelatinilytica]